MTTETIYAIVIFAALVFIIYQVDRLISGAFGRGRKSDLESTNDIITPNEAADLDNDGVPDVSALPHSPQTTAKDALIDRLTAENIRLQTEVDALRDRLLLLQTLPPPTTELDSDEFIP